MAFLILNILSVPTCRHSGCMWPSTGLLIASRTRWEQFEGPGPISVLLGTYSGRLRTSGGGTSIFPGFGSLFSVYVTRSLCLWALLSPNPVEQVDFVWRGVTFSAMYVCFCGVIWRRRSSSLAGQDLTETLAGLLATL